MDPSASVIVDDPRTVRDICGPHDRNLRLMEELLGASILARGNEIILSMGDGHARDRFHELLGELLRYARDGREVHPDLVRASWDSLHQDPASLEALRDQALSIPGASGRIFPRTLNQARFLKGLKEHPMCFGIGPAGTGKTYLAVAHAMGELLSRRCRKLVLTRPVVEAGENLGFLPGDLEQKLDPYVRPLWDAMESLVSADVLRRMAENRVVEIAPLAYMRGRSLQDSFIILDEAQNTTREQMKMFLTRLGEGSRAVITGDITQIDLPRSGQSGLIHAMTILEDIDDIHFSFFTGRDVVRSSLVQKIIQAYDGAEELHEKGRNPPRNTI